MRALWPGLVVEENSLSQVISGLRRALADDPHDSRYIQTVPRRGFRFIATVTALPDATAAPAAPPLRTPLHGRCLSVESAAPADCIAWRHDRRASDKRRWLRLALANSVAAGLGGIGWWASHRAPAAGITPAQTLDAGRAAVQAAGGRSPRRAAGSGHGRQPDRAPVHRARAGGALDRLGAPLCGRRPGPPARGARVWTWRGSSTARCSGVATNCASPRVCSAQPTAAPPGAAASTRNSPGSSMCRT